MVGASLHGSGDGSIVRRSCSGFELGLRGFFKETELTRDIYIVLYKFINSNSHKKYYRHFTS